MNYWKLHIPRNIKFKTWVDTRNTRVTRSLNSPLFAQWAKTREKKYILAGQCTLFGWLHDDYLKDQNQCFLKFPLHFEGTLHSKIFQKTLISAFEVHCPAKMDFLLHFSSLCMYVVFKDLIFILECFSL